MTDNQLKIISLIKNNPNISARKLSEEIGISSRKIESNIAMLKKKEIIKRVGSSKGGHWEIVE